MPTWFRRPTDDRPGTLNPCYDALDRHVVAGRADEVALLVGDRPITVATLLEQVGALAGGLHAVGLQPGQRVAAHLGDPYDALLVTLAALRLGAVAGDVEPPDLLVTDGDEPTTAGFRVVRGPVAVDPEHEVAWDLLLQAGRQVPAACVEVEADAPAYVVAGRVVTAEQAATDDSPTGRLLLALTEGRPVEL